MTTPAERTREFQAKLAALSDEELAELISRAMRAFDVGLLVAATEERVRRG